MLLDGRNLINAEIWMLLQDVTCESALCEASVEALRSGGGGGVGAGAQGTSAQVNSGKAPYQQICILDETTSWAHQNRYCDSAWHPAAPRILRGSG